MAEYFTKDGEEFKKVDDNLLTQGDVDKVVESRLDRQKKQYADYDDLKEKATKVDTIAQEFEDKLKAAGEQSSELEKQLGVAKLDTEKVKVIHEFKLSEDLAEFVTGDTVEDMRKRAEKLSKGATGGKVVINKDKKPESKETDSKKIAKSLFGSGSDD
jgi:glutamate synthase domain-containing protein 3